MALYYHKSNYLSLTTILTHRGYELIRTMQLVGINVITRTEVEECFAVIDDEIVWHGGMNLLGKADVWDNLMRIRNSQVATELLEIALGCSEERRKSE